MTAVKRAMVTKGPIEPKMEGGTALGALSLVRVGVRARLSVRVRLPPWAPSAWLGFGLGLGLGLELG